LQDPIIESIKKAEDRLTNSASFLRFLGQQFVNERADVPEEEEEEVLEEEKYHFMSLVLNLVNTYLYMVSAVASPKAFFLVQYKFYFSFSVLMVLHPYLLYVTASGAQTCSYHLLLECSKNVILHGVI
jgi:hypothetical protein